MNAMERQSVLTCVSPLRPRAAAALTAHLHAANAEEAGGKRLLGSIASLHFARLFVVPPARDAEGHYLPAALVCSAWHDGSQSDCIDALAERAAPLLGLAFEHCEDFSRNGAPLTARVRGHLKRHAVAPLAYFNGAPCRSVEQIRLEQALVETLRRSLDDCEHDDPWTIFETLRDHARSDAALSSAFAEPPRFQLTRAEQAARWIGFVIRTAPLWLRFFLSLSRVRRDELRDRSAEQVDRALAPPPRQMARDSTQNAYNSATIMRPGAAHRHALRAFLEFLQVVGSMRTDLSGIVTMRFAHWAELDGGRRLLFCSVYDGSWETYLSDFIELAGWGLTGVWSHTLRYPPADFLILNGARREQWFRRYVREQEIEAPFFYRAYPGPSCEQLDDASRIRRELRRARSAEEVKRWLSLF